MGSRTYALSSQFALVKDVILLMKEALRNAIEIEDPEAMKRAKMALIEKLSNDPIALLMTQFGDAVNIKINKKVTKYINDKKNNK